MVSGDDVDVGWALEEVPSGDNVGDNVDDGDDVGNDVDVGDDVGKLSEATGESRSFS